MPSRTNRKITAIDHRKMTLQEKLQQLKESHEAILQVREILTDLERKRDRITSEIMAMTVKDIM